MRAPVYEGVDLTSHIGNAITFSPTSTIHGYQVITFEGGKLYLDVNMVFRDGKLAKVIEVVVTSPPSREKLAYCEELGLECEVIMPAKEPTPPAKGTTPPAKGGSTTAYQPSMFSVDDSDEEDM
ncbi:hypothetical protein T492DRAFT_844162 [Pavlovales sp. CCMP2436]|nr:hypothetical protein T492DRAFT_844162 [Pavlovales sp. CCMP2436]